MQRRALLIGIALTATFLGCAHLHAQDCQCAGTPMGVPFSGGQGDPLKWTFRPNEVTHTPLLICYYKEVTNAGKADVRDVRWEIADFYRRIIRGGVARSGCPEIDGNPKPTPTNGPLYYGSSHYDTTILEPEKGWGNGERPATQGNRGSIDGEISGKPIRTAFTVDVEDESGKLATARLNFVSSVKTDGNKNFLTYSVENDSSVNLSVLVNLNATAPILEKIPMIQRSFTVSPGKLQTFTTVAEGKSSIEPAAIVVYDMRKQISAIESGGFYTVKGSKERPDEVFWKAIR
jgi:hypothetical protein